ncbi:pentapeptide repeat-containing protein [Pseudomonas sp. BN414]|uniref:ion channel n=1 Tax=Pseudomonas sp. BN414 TaxID=2567888 RepID=UPI0024569D2F|nr:pentapeptide repeat-containing protein [Pseudomonas sp. BN414]MDH4570293.1 pentapeptide repeat-containing protein [Pseudomonas sp. BN414]
MLDIPPEDDFWRDAKQDKSGTPELGPALEARARNGAPMRGFSLKRCQLAGLDLVHRGSHTGYDLSGSDFYRANLRGAHLFAINLRGASLMKADLRDANLHCADLRDANLLGVKLDGARLDNVVWDEHVLQEREAREACRSRQPALMLDLLQQAEEVYRNLRIHLEKAGLFEEAGRFFYREMVTRRLQMPRWSTRRLFSWLVDLFCGYGEQPLRVVLFSLGFVLFCGLLFFAMGIHHGAVKLAFALDQDLLTNLTELSACMYFSVVTFTTLGYGDIAPLGLSRPLAAFEAFVGSFTMALFVVVFVKKMTR